MMKRTRPTIVFQISFLLAAGYLSGCIVVPAPIESHYNRGVEQYDKGNYAKSIEHYKRALSRNPNDSFAKYNLAVVYQDQGKHDRALELYREILKKEEHSNSRVNIAAIYSTQGKTGKAIEELKTAAQSNPDTAHPLSALGEYLVRENRLEEAGQAYRKALRIDDRHALTQHRLGKLDIKRGRTESGLDRLRKAVELAPGQTLFLETLGEEYARTGNPSEAIHSFERASVLEPDREYFFVRLGDLYKKNEQYQKAIVRYWSALSINDGNPHVHRNLAEIFEHLARTEKKKLGVIQQKGALAQTPPD